MEFVLPRGKKMSMREFLRGSFADLGAAGAACVCLQFGSHSSPLSHYNLNNMELVALESSMNKPGGLSITIALYHAPDDQICWPTNPDDQACRNGWLTDLIPRFAGLIAAVR